jgi:hypothetical protein
MDGPSQTNAPFQLLSVDPRLRTIQWLCHATWLRQLLLLEGTFRLNCLIKKRKKTSEKKKKKKKKKRKKIKKKKKKKKKKKPPSLIHFFLQNWPGNLSIFFCMA